MSRTREQRKRQASICGPRKTSSAPAAQHHTAPRRQNSVTAVHPSHRARLHSQRRRLILGKTVTKFNSANVYCRFLLYSTITFCIDSYKGRGTGRRLSLSINVSHHERSRCAARYASIARTSSTFRSSRPCSPFSYRSFFNSTSCNLYYSTNCTKACMQ